MYAYAYNNTPLSQLELSSYQIVFHTHHQIPLTFSLSLLRDSSEKCIGKYSTSRPPHTHFCAQHLNPFFYSHLDKPITSWLSSAEHALLEIYSTVHRHIFKS